MWSKAVVNRPGEKFCEEAIQKTVVSSAYIKVSPDLIDEGKSFVKSVNKVGANTEPCGTPDLTYIFEVLFLLSS